MKKIMQHGELGRAEPFQFETVCEVFLQQFEGATFTPFFGPCQTTWRGHGGNYSGMVSLRGVL